MTDDRTFADPTASAVPPPDSPRPGTYEHHKGGRYRVLDVARHSETERWLVVYRTLYGERGLWVRPLEMFVDEVDIAGTLRPRFRRVGD